MVKYISRLVTAVLAIFGLIELYQWSAGEEPLFGALIVLLALAIVLGNDAVQYLIRPLALRHFGMTGNPYCFILKAHVDLAVDSQGVATIDTTREYIFTELPKPGQLFDTLHAIPGFPEDQITFQQLYRSNDAIVTGFRRHRSDRLVVFWQPRSDGEQIQKLRPYSHHFRWTVPGNMGETVNYFQAFRPFDVGTYTAQFTTSRPLRDVWAVRRPRHLAAVNSNSWFRALKTSKEAECVPQPELTGPHTFKWRIDDPQGSISYVVMWDHADSESHNSTTA